MGVSLKKSWEVTLFATPVPGFFKPLFCLLSQEKSAKTMRVPACNFQELGAIYRNNCRWARFLL
ncbi:hypothetical protein [Aquabacterium sp.]|uniref:hypothetical protein n=1 Tax=Aquabacterium sp. TaxID=1872578 RepID=UPI003D6CD7A1